MKTSYSETSFNLVRDPWIPVSFLDGRFARFSLRGAFSRGNEIRDLAVAPHERIAVMRLLICIAQAALDGPADDEPETWEEAAEALISATESYLTKWEPAFELFGDGPRFLQRRTDKTSTMPASKLFLNLATGNNPTLFDHSGGEDRSFSEESLALALVTYQNFSPLVGRGFTGRGPCVDRNALHVLRLGDDLADSVLANCLSRESCPMTFGRPIWEKETEENATRTYLGRLAPRTRAIWLSDERNAFVMDNSFLYPVHPAWREPTCAEKLIRKKDADEPLLIPASLARGVWRELDALLAERPEERSAPPLTLRRRYPGCSGLWTGGMVTDYKAKVEDLAESVFIGDRAIPGVMFADPVVRSWYRGGIASAETWSWAVSKAVAAFSTALKLDENSRAGIRDVAQRHYWNAAERGLPQLFALVVALDAEPELLKREDRAFTPDEPDAPSSWHSALRAAARNAYRTACPQNTARQILAYVQGEKALYLTSRKSTAKTQTTLRPV